jgi:hypothetical protein
MVEACKFCMVAVLVVMTGCAGPKSIARPTDAVERGLEYIGRAIVISAIIRAIFNK